MRDIEKLPYDPEQKILHQVDEVDIALWKSSWGNSANHTNVFSEDDLEWLTDQMYRPVSYTHLTLPTICSV